MASRSETGIKTNLSNYRLMIDRITEFGTNYNPSNVLLLKTNMTLQWTDAKTLHEDYLTALEAASVPMKNRETKYESLKKIVIKSINFFESTTANRLAIEKARGIVKIMLGYNVKVQRLEDGTPDPKHISNSHQSYNEVINRFFELLQLYISNTEYAPNENAIKITELQTLYTDTETLNTSVNGVVAHAIQLRHDRDHALYDIGPGIIDVSLACKKYVRSLYGPGSDEAKSITEITLTRFKKMWPV